MIDMLKVIKYLPVFFMLFFISCKREIGKTSWNTQLAVPIAQSSLGLGEILTDSIIKVGDDDALMFVFNAPLYKINYDTILKMPDTTISNSYRNIINTSFSPGQQIYATTNSTRYALGEVQLSSITIKKGKVKFKISSTVKEKIVFEYKLPCATKNGSVFSINEIVSAGTSTQPGVFEKEYDMSGYTINLKGISNNSYNSIFYNVSAKVDPNGNPVLVTYYDSVKFENSFSDLYPFFAKGYFGQQSFSVGPETTDFSVFRQILGGSISLENAKLNFTLKNGIGVDASAIINQLYSKNTRTGNTVQLANSLVGSNINLNRATESGNAANPVNYTYRNFTMDNSNSNLKALLENLPDKLGYAINLKVNPNGNISGGTDFIYFDNPLETNLSLEIPASFAANKLQLVDTIAIDLASLKDKNKIQSGTVQLLADNGFPFNARIQLYMLDAQKNIIDSLVTDNLMSSGTINSNNIVSTKKLSIIRFPLNSGKIENLTANKQLLLKVIFDTDNYPTLYRIYKDYKVDLKLTGEFNYLIEKN